MVIACVHLAKVTSKRVVNIAGIIENNEMQYDNGYVILPPHRDTKYYQIST